MEPSEDFISGENVQIVYCEVFHGPEKQAVKVCILKGSVLLNKNAYPRVC